MNVLFIANARRSGGLSGGDNIYLNLAKRLNGKHDIWDMMNIDFKPFWLCYIYRVIVACGYAMFKFKKYDIVYSASDFWMDCLPAFIFKLKYGIKWIACYYLEAPKDNKIYFVSQKLAYLIIKKFADIVCITNDSYKHIFKDKKTVSVWGGVDFDLVKNSQYDTPIIYDAVFCGRFHYTKGIKELLEIWHLIVEQRPNAKLAIIGGGDQEQEFNFENKKGIYLLGMQDEDRFITYKNSKIVLYPTPPRYDHFSMSPIEAMACGCPMVSFELKSTDSVNPNRDGMMEAENVDEFANMILGLLDDELDMSLLSQEAIEYAKQWDWNIRAKKIWEEICEYL